MSADSRRGAIPTSWSELRATMSKSIDDLSLTHRFARYFMVGGASAVVDYGIFASLFYVGVHYLLAAGISFVIAVAFNYYWSIRFVFRTGRHPRHREILLIYFVSGMGIALNLVILAALVEWAGLHPLMGKVAGSAVVLAWNFCARHFWIFAR